MSAIVERIAARLVKRHLTLGTVESATGGLVSNLLTDLPGSSRFYKGSIIAYSNEIKTVLVGVSAATLEVHGAVSARAAEEMAAGGRRLLNVDMCISDTGIAGPGGGTGEKPVGLFYLGLSYEQGTFSRRHLFNSIRTVNKQSAAEAALDWLDELLSGTWVPRLS